MTSVAAYASRLFAVLGRWGGIRVCYGVTACLLLWVTGYLLTEFRNPIFQARGLWARWSGPKLLRTRREAETNMAKFHLTYAVRNVYTFDSMQTCRELPRSWADLIRETGDYRGSHMAGCLVQAYPMLLQQVDPWGRPWVFRIEAINRFSRDSEISDVDIRFTFGSLGPDGIECTTDRSRTECDDIISSVEFVGFPAECLPNDVPIVSGKTEFFTVPSTLW